jgi:hypothetical protein
MQLNLVLISGVVNVLFALFLAPLVWSKEWLLRYYGLVLDCGMNLAEWVGENVQWTITHLSYYGYLYVIIFCMLFTVSWLIWISLKAIVERRRLQILNSEMEECDLEAPCVLKGKLTIFDNQVYIEAELSGTRTLVSLTSEEMHDLVLFSTVAAKSKSQQPKKEMALPGNPFSKAESVPSYQTFIAYESQILGCCFRVGSSLVMSYHVWMQVIKFQKRLHVLRQGEWSKRIALTPDKWKLASLSVQFDFVVLQPKEQAIFAVLGLTKGVCAKLQAGAGITVFGMNEANNLVSSHGVVVKAKGVRFFYTASTLPGFSGAPVISNGKIVGIHAGTEGGFNYGHPTEFIFLGAKEFETWSDRSRHVYRGKYLDEGEQFDRDEFRFNNRMDYDEAVEGSAENYYLGLGSIYHGDNTVSRIRFTKSNAFLYDKVASDMGPLKMGENWYDAEMEFLEQLEQEMEDWNDNEYESGKSAVEPHDESDDESLTDAPVRKLSSGFPKRKESGVSFAPDDSHAKGDHFERSLNPGDQATSSKAPASQDVAESSVTSSTASNSKRSRSKAKKKSKVSVGLDTAEMPLQ